MRHVLPAVAAVAVLGLAPVARAQQESAAAVAARIGDRIESSSVAGDGSVDPGRAIAVIDAPIARVMAVVTDYAHYQDFLPSFRQSRVLSRRGLNALVYMQASVARNTTTLWAQMRIFARRPRGQTRIIEGRMVEGNMATFIARWEVTPLDANRTLVQFDITVDPDLPLPDSLFSDENVKAARKTLRALRRRLEG